MHNTSRTLELLDHLIAYPTVSQNSNLDLIDWAESHLRDWGFDVTRIWSPDRTKAGLFARIGPKVDGGICLSGHTDVVPVEGQHWTHPHFTLSHVGDRVYGRGSTDMKGFVASALAIAEQAGKHTLKAPLSLVLSYDEEIGCVGIREMLPQLTPLLGKPDLVIVGEPTSMQIAIGHKGKAALSVTCGTELCQRNTRGQPLHCRDTRLAVPLDARYSGQRLRHPLLDGTRWHDIRRAGAQYRA